MRYMMLVYSTEPAEGIAPEELARIRSGHMRVMSDAAEKGILIGAEPLAPTSTATTVRIQNGKPLITDGPFAETKSSSPAITYSECHNLDEAIDWAARIPTSCNGGPRLHRNRPLRAVPRPADSERNPSRVRVKWMTSISLLKPSSAANRVESSQV